MRTTVFRRLMTEEFGPGRSDMLASSHILGALNGRTADQALADGVSPKQIWRAICEEFEVPPERR